MDRRLIAGRRHESDVEFHLRRTLFAGECYIFNNVKLTFNGENAQFDHLALHPYGFIVMESKSICGEVMVNSHGEWSRSYKGKWEGIPSPIKQAELQINILKSVLDDNRDSILGKLLGIRKGFGGRKYDIIAAISSSAIFHRDTSPKEISDQVFKVEFLGEAVNKILGSYSGFSQSNPWFNKTEMENIRKFLSTYENIVEGMTVDITPNGVRCKACANDSTLKAASGRYGYFVICQCGANTSLRSNCRTCGSKNTKVSKIKYQYTQVCNDCEANELVGIFESSSDRVK